MSLRKILKVLFPETSKMVELKITRIQADEDFQEKKANGEQQKDGKLFDKKAESVSTKEPDFYDVTFKLQA